MTIPSSDQLAADVPPAIRDYIDAKVREAREPVAVRVTQLITEYEQKIALVNQRLADIDTLERTVRAMLGMPPREE